jgi:hypothetical protein
MVTATAAAWFGFPARSPGEVRVPVSAVAVGGPPMPKGTAVGQSGCLAAACHGGPAAKALAGQFDARTWMASGTCWIASDPHRAAYEVLVSDQPRRPGQTTAAEIMRRLGSAVPATEDARCLACHTNPALAEPGHTTDARILALRREGVSCESCHGNAGGWLREHTTGQTSGMTALVEVGNRATICVGCHVGAPADRERGYPVRDINHDMIAAGHPRLNFDFAEYQRRLPRHWREKTSNHPAREWIIGRVVHAEAACRLLADRAERAAANDPRSPWPEFAEFRCAACHHKFADPGYPAASSNGSLKWQSVWPAAKLTDLESLLKPMRASRPLRAQEVIETARRAGWWLEHLRHSLASLSDADLADEARPLFPRSVPPTADADEMGQLLLGLAALERGKDDAVFARAFESYRRREWGDVRLTLDVLLRRFHR